MNYRLLVFFCALSSSLFAQQTEIVDFTRATAEIEILPFEKMVEGKVQYEFKILQKTDSVYLDARNMEFSIPNSDSKIKLNPSSEKLWLIFPFEKDKTYQVHFSYSAKPSQTMYFVGWENEGSNQVWTQGQGKKTSYWLPSIDDLNEKIEFDLTISAPKPYEVVANGLLKTRTEISDSVTAWNFDMSHPMSSYLVALAVGKYHSENLSSKTGVPIKLFYEPKDSAKVEPTYRYSKEIFDFLEEEIGVAFPWEVYKQVPVRDFLYAGMENTTLTIFAQTFVIDSVAFIDRNFVNVNAHELAHQWFGDFVTEVSSEHHWLQEGFATYYALLAERQIFGDDYYYFKLYQT
ncbi:MAG TPA: M1 family metallopeptidase, partial [Flavobacteriaceae bacterium]|nr:M1 family metallopeptidase [Flavobacteriaceae bacterium]